MNPELISGAQEAAAQRDNRLLVIQNQIGASMAAIGTVLDLLLTKKERGEEDLAIIEKLSDAGRILADVHHTQTGARRSTGCSI